jgi:protein SCO1
MAGELITICRRCALTAACLSLALPPGVVLAFGGSATGSEAVAGRPGGAETLPADLVNVGIEEHLGANIPLDAVFLDEDGKEVRISSYFHPGRPVLLNFAYYECPMLCTMVLNGMVKGIKKMAWMPGKEFEVVTISIDPGEGPKLAADKKATHIAALGKPEAAQGWHFLTGKEADIRRVTDAIGFKYQYNPISDEFAHVAGVYTLSPEGKICRYLYGIDYRSKDLRLALLDASEGRSLSIGDKIIMFCYRYDANAKGYVLFARNFMRGGGYLFMAGFILLMGGLWRREWKRKAAERMAANF